MSRGAAVVAPPPLRNLTLRPPAQYSPTYDPRCLLYLSGAFPMLPHGRTDGAACALMDIETTRAPTQEPGLQSLLARGARQRRSVAFLRCFADRFATVRLAL